MLSNIRNDKNFNIEFSQFTSLSKDYIYAAEILLNGWKKNSSEISQFKPFIYVLCHAYECYLKAARIVYGIKGKKRSHILIDLSQDLFGKIDDGVLQYAVWLSNHHCFHHENANAFPDRYDDYKFDSRKTMDLWHEVKEKQIELGLDKIDALGPFNQELKDKLDPSYTLLRKMVTNSVRIVPSDFNDCIKILKDELNKLGT